MLGLLPRLPIMITAVGAILPLPPFPFAASASRHQAGRAPFRFQRQFFPRRPRYLEQEGRAHIS